MSNNVLRLVCVLIGVVFGPRLAGAQSRCTWLSTFDKPFVLDSTTIIPGSIVIKNDSLAALTYNVNTRNAVLKKGIRDSVQVCYTPIAYDLSREVYRRSYTAYQENEQHRDNTPGDSAEMKAPLMEKEELFGSDQLYKSGSLTRGVSFGNTQDVFVNSSLNLQLEGQLADNLKIRAAITDQNVPYQPEGNTARVQEFDNVFIEMYNDNLSLKGGDLVFSNLDNQFLRFTKNVQGGMGDIRYAIDSNKAHTRAGIAVAKGQFASITLSVEEGVQGPYVIPVGNSTYTIIMANSERVYLDGELLQRGIKNDYIIDYNQAEITFTSKVLLTEFSRVRIDVEYSDEQYSRTIFTASHEQDIGKSKVYIHHYSEKDNKNQSLSTDISDEEALYLSTIGDSLDLAYSEGETEVDFNEDEILYIKKDTVVSGISYTIYAYTSEEQDSVFRVSFADEGAGEGDYVLESTLATGKVYEWAGPGNGRYMPLKTLPVPNKKSMTVFGGQVPISGKGYLFGEMAISDHDDNLFSLLDDEDNKGYAYKIGYRLNKNALAIGRHYKVTGVLSYEYDNEDFAAIDRFRSIEFDRDWSYDPDEDEDHTEDRIIVANVTLEKDAAHQLTYQFSDRTRGDYIDGTQQQLNLNYQWKRLSVQSEGFLMRNETSDFLSKWKRVQVDAAYRNPHIVPGYVFARDDNRVYTGQSDSVTSTAMNYRSHSFYLMQGDSSKVTYKAQYTFREDYQPDAGQMELYTRAQTIRLDAEKQYGKQVLSMNMIYRKSDNFDSDTVNSEETIQGQINWSGRFIKDIFSTDLTYSISNALELKRDFVYVKVATGEGTHTWRDDNEDGVKDLSEFYIAINNDEKNYIKVYSTTNEYIQSYDMLFNYRLSFRLPTQWRNSGFILKTLRRFSGNMVWTVNRDIVDDDLFNRLMPFERDLEQEDLLSRKNLLKGTLFLNQGKPGFGMSFSFAKNDSKQFLTNGFDSSGREIWASSVRGVINRTYFLELQYQNVRISSASDYLDGRTYQVQQHVWTPELSWQPGTRFRLTGGVELKKKNSLTAELPGSALFREASLQLKYNKPGDQSANVKMSWIDIDFDGESNTALGYELLEALSAGRNATWQVIWQKRVIKGLQVSLQYEGRATEDSEVVHIGRMQVSALF